MARREIDVDVTAEGRDKGKTFHLTEMPAAFAEEWAGRMLLAITRAGIDIPEGAMSNPGMGELAATAGPAIERIIRGGIGNLQFDEIKPLLDQMLQCVMIREKSGLRALTDDDIEEVGTRLTLRVEVFKLHTDFSKSAEPAA